MKSDLIIVGAGPAGGHAALAAAETGLSVVLVDEQPEAGGQIWRAPWQSSSMTAPSESGDGDRLRAALKSSRVQLRLHRTVWSVGGNFRVDAIGPDGNEVFEAPRLISAMGAHERVVPFPGWTLPGVIGLAATTVILKSHRMVPASPVVVAGCGPLLVAVAAGIIKAGGKVAAIADLAGPADWLSAIPSLALRPTMMAEGLGWVAHIVKERVPVHFRHTVLRAIGRDHVEAVVIGPVSETGSPKTGSELSFPVSCLVVGHGLVPGGDIPRQLRAEMKFDRLQGGHIPVTDEFGRTSVPGLYAVGDGSGIRGVEAAVIGGRLAGLVAALDQGSLRPIDRNEEVDHWRRSRSRLHAASSAMARLMALRPEHVDGIPGDTIVCRCEDVTRFEIESAIDAGASDINQLKHFTRCGMGPCQGRICGDVVQELVSRRLSVSRDVVGQWTSRPPLRPVSLADLTGSFDYSDIPIPIPAPL